MKIIVCMVFVLLNQFVALAAPPDELLAAYSDVAVAFVDADKTIKDLVVVCGVRFSLKKLRMEALGAAITHPSILPKDRICLLLKNPKAAGVPNQRVVWFDSMVKNIDEYGEIDLNSLLRLRTPPRERGKQSEQHMPGWLESLRAN